MSAKVIRLRDDQSGIRSSTLRQVAAWLTSEGGQEWTAALSEAERNITARALQKVAAEPPGEARLWESLHSMLNRQQTAEVWEAIDALPPKHRPRQVRRVFDQVILNMGFDTGEIALTRNEIAERAKCSPDDVSLAMKRLEEIGAIVRGYERVPGMRGRGKVVYQINPHVAWTGNMREAARRANESPIIAAQGRLKLVVNKKGD